MTGAPEVLVLRALGLGDLLTAVPALRGLRRAYPGHRILLAAPPALGTWFCDLGLVDGTVPATGLAQPLPVDRAPDLAVDLHGRGPASHRLLRATGAAALLGFRCPGAGHVTGPEWREDEHEVDRWVRLVRTLGPVADPRDLRLGGGEPGNGAVLVHPGASAPARRWPLERWAEVVAALVGRGRPVVVTGTAAEADLARPLVRAGAQDRTGRDDLPALAALVAGSDLLLSSDTGVAHVATAYGTPSVTLFGPVSPALWGPRIDAHLHRVLWHAEPASGRPGDANGARLDPRLARVTVEEVLAAANELLDGAQAEGAPASCGAEASSSTGS